MSFPKTPEPFVDGGTVCTYLGGVSHVTLWRYVQRGLPYHLARNGRRMYRLSEVDQWFFDIDDQDGYQFKRTDSPAGGTEDVA